MGEQLKSKVIAFEVYPDSLPPPFVTADNVPLSVGNELAKRGFSGAVSPLHEPLKNPVRDDSDGVKPHYHVMCVFSVARSIEMVSNLSHDLFNGTNAVAIAELDAYDRYLTHFGHQDKQQFIGVLPTDFGSFHSEEYYIDVPKSVWCVDFIEKNNCKSFKSFVDTLRKQGQIWAIEYISRNTFFFKMYIQDKAEFSKNKNNKKE